MEDAICKAIAISGRKGSVGKGFVDDGALPPKRRGDRARTGSRSREKTREAPMGGAKTWIWRAPGPAFGAGNRDG